MTGETEPRSDLQDLGFGSRVTRDTKTRLLNRDGTFNVSRESLSVGSSLSPYHYMLRISWTRFYVLVAAVYILFNLTFASCYYLAGRSSLTSSGQQDDGGRILDDFFFSVQTSTTIGYGRIAPVGLAANTLASCEALLGLMGFALTTSLLFARFSRPSAKIIYSENAVVAPYRKGRALMFRIANARESQLIQVGVRVLLTMTENSAGKPKRRFHPLSLERDEVMFFPLTWTIVHPIDERSPMHRMTEEEFRRAEPEILILLSGVDETFSQTVHSRTSYRGNEIIWGAKFADVFGTSDDGTLAVDLQKIHAYDTVALPGSRAQAVS
jgi:inward rectifier potassium channel